MIMCLSVKPLEVKLLNSILEYTYQTFHSSLPAYLSSQIERVQKRLLRILFPEVSYSKAQEDVGLKPLFHRRDELYVEPCSNKL